MKIEYFKNGSITTYNEAETAFIDTLCKEAQKNIHIGLATPYDYGYKPVEIVGRVTLDEDNEDIGAAYDTYISFIIKLGNYILYNASADENAFRLLKTLNKYTNSALTTTEYKTKSASLITYLNNQWGAFTESVLDETFKYMNVTNLVLDSLKNFIK